MLAIRLNLWLNLILSWILFQFVCITMHKSLSQREMRHYQCKWIIHEFDISLNCIITVSFCRALEITWANSISHHLRHRMRVRFCGRIKSNKILKLDTIVPECMTSIVSCSSSSTQCFIKCATPCGWNSLHNIINLCSEHSFPGLNEHCINFS